MEQQKTGLELMRAPFPAHQISKMCRSTKKDNQKGKCPKCGGWHGLPAIQLDYVGHAALTDRLLEADPAWTWEPMAVGPDGYPVLDRDGGMWIKLTVCGVTRYGYGDAQGKTGGDAMKERIGDALRNAAMRFGAALDLWHKGDLHADEEAEETPKRESFKSEPASAWDKMDADTKEWMLSEAMNVTAMTSKGDIEGAYLHLESLNLDDENKTAFWSRLDATQRSAIKAYSSIIHAATLDALERVWAATPKHSQKALEAIKEKRKAELAEPKKAAA